MVSIVFVVVVVVVVVPTVHCDSGHGHVLDGLSRTIHFVSLPDSRR